MNTPKTISKKDFAALITQNGWAHEQSHEINFSYEDEVNGGVQITSSNGEVIITYEEGFKYSAQDPKKTLSTSVEGIYMPLIIQGVRVVDVDGEELGPGDLFDLLPAAFTCVDYAEVTALSKE